MTIRKCIGKGNEGSTTDIDMRNTRIWVVLGHCTCSDNPYEDACDFCLHERGYHIGYTDKEVMRIITKDMEKNNEE